uniref:ymf99 n=1 Tax=Peronosclerospora sorghi TaxID=230839 RepID=UPI0022FD5B31|nr:ymf99 [Peronosclerospora sorghi]WAU47943.1 ymf99 [Peronosclerospora sorghi]
MKKLKKKKINILLNYQQFLKNNSLKKKFFKSKNSLLENQILYKNPILETSIIEFNNYENIYLPFTLIKINEISIIDLQYENIILFNYDLTFNILKKFNRIMFPYIINFQNNLIKGRLLGGNWNNKKILISILGFIFPMKPMNLNNALNYKKIYFFNKYNKKGFYKKKINSTRLINCYKIKYLNFKIKNKKNNLKKKELSRLSYIQFIFQKKKLKKKKKFSFKKKKMSKIKI